MKKKTLVLSRDTFLYLFDLSTRNLERLDRDSHYSDEDCKNYSWMREDRKNALDILSVAKRLHEALLFGEDSDV